MLELPEVLNITSQLQENVAGKSVSHILPPTKEHKFCWYNGEPSDYSIALEGKNIIGAEGFGIFAEILFEEGYKLCFNDNCVGILTIITKSFILLKQSLHFLKTFFVLT